MPASDRRHPLIDLDRATLLELLQPVAAPHDVAHVELVTRGLSSTNYRIDQHAGPPLLLRIVPSGRAVCEKEVAVYRHVAGTVPVPRVWHAAATHPRVPHYIAEWIEGTPLDTLLDSGPLVDPLGLGAAIATTLAAIHAHTFACGGDLGRDMRIVPWPVMNEGADPHDSAFLAHMRHFMFNSPATARLGASRVQRLWPRVLRQNASLERVTRRPCLVHSDYNPHNLLVRRQSDRWQVAAVLDWEFACAAGPLLDVGNLLRHRDTYPPAFVEGFIHQYRALAPWLEDGWLEQARLVDLSSAVESLSSDHDRPGPHAMALGMIDRFLEE